MKPWNSLAALALIAATSGAALGATYSIDPVHSSAVFRIKHMGATFIYGRVTAPEGAIVYDAAKPEDSKFDVTMQIANVDTANKQRDDHLKSATFFNATDFPTMTFKSTAVKKVDATRMKVTGDLTIHGVTKSVTVNMEHTGDGKMQNKPIAGFEATFEIKRSDFGMKEMIGPVGDDVKIVVSLEGDQK